MAATAATPPRRAAPARHRPRGLEGTQYREGVVPGKLRTESVVVGGYRAAPAEDGKYLVDRLAEWLNGPIFIHDEPEIQFALILAKAVFAHLYIAWIHLFGDGNGRPPGWWSS
ncbi:MAG: Fic family protein [Streptosporangiaceae bacterium]